MTTPKDKPTLDDELRAELKELNAKELLDILFSVRCIKQGWTFSEIVRALMYSVN